MQTRIQKSACAQPVLIATLLALGALAPTQAFAVDAAAADALLEDSKCGKCHDVIRKKDGPAFRDVAAKFRGDGEAEQKLTHHLTSGEKVKFPDGHQESHKKVKTSNPAEIKNLIAWIQSLEGGRKY